MRKRTKYIKILVNLFSVVLVLLLITGIVYAEDMNGTSAAEKSDRVAAIEFTTDGEGNEIAEYTEGFSVTAPSAILMDMDSGQVLYGKNIFTGRYPASITKVMTALVAVEFGNPEDQVVFDEECVYSIESGSANAGMMIGETISLDSCLRCMMAQSANECAYAAGKTVAGSMESFISMMNDTAENLGCVNSHFVNPHGLHDDDHYVCAYDMALIASTAYQYEWFRDFCHLETYERPLTNMNPEDNWVMYNRHQMFHPDSEYYYEYVTGGKTGYTDQANTTLVTYAEKDGRSLAVVVLNCAGVEVYESTRSLFDYGFNNFINYNASDIVDGSIVESVDSDIIMTVPAGTSADDIEERLSAGEDREADLIFLLEGREIGRTTCIMTQEYRLYLNDEKKKMETDETSEKVVVEVNEEEFNADDYKINYKAIIIAAALIVLLILAIYLLILRKRRKIRRNKHKPGKKSYYR